MAELEVCRICFGSTSRKPNPTLTPESKAIFDVSTKKKKCSACRQEWVPIKVAKEIGQGVGADRWVRIRPKPKIPANVDFQICNKVQSKTECPRGQDCSYAHSEVELLSWNKEQQNEPRPAPHSGPYQLCKRMQNTGKCQYGQRCNFAHSGEELRLWLSTQAGANQVPSTSSVTGETQVGFDFQCDVCNLSCTSKRLLDDHISESGHKQQITAHTLRAYSEPTPAQSIAHVRRRPLLSFPLSGYKLCRDIEAGRQCIYGDYCTFAHSQGELEEWNSQLQIVNTPHLSWDTAMFHGGGLPPYPPPVGLMSTMPGAGPMGVGMGEAPMSLVLGESPE